MQIPNPAAVFTEQQPDYHIQSQVDYEDGDGASFMTLKNAPRKKRNYKPVPLRWPFLLSQFLLLLLGASLIAFSLSLLPNTHSSSLISKSTNISPLDRRQEPAAENQEPSNLSAEENLIDEGSQDSQPERTDTLLLKTEGEGGQETVTEDFSPQTPTESPTKGDNKDENFEDKPSSVNQSSEVPATITGETEVINSSVLQETNTVVEGSRTTKNTGNAFGTTSRQTMAPSPETSEVTQTREELQAESPGTNEIASPPTEETSVLIVPSGNIDSDLKSSPSHKVLPTSTTRHTIPEGGDPVHSITITATWTDTRTERSTCTDESILVSSEDESWQFTPSQAGTTSAAHVGSSFGSESENSGAQATSSPIKGGDSNEFDSFHHTSHYSLTHYSSSLNSGFPAEIQTTLVFETEQKSITEAASEWTDASTIDAGTENLSLTGDGSHESLKITSSYSIIDQTPPFTTDVESFAPSQTTNADNWHYSHTEWENDTRTLETTTVTEGDEPTFPSPSMEKQTSTFQTSRVSSGSEITFIEKPNTREPSSEDDNIDMTITNSISEDRQMPTGYPQSENSDITASETFKITEPNEIITKESPSTTTQLNGVDIIPISLTNMTNYNRTTSLIESTTFNLKLSLPISSTDIPRPTQSYRIDIIEATPPATVSIADFTTTVITTPEPRLFITEMNGYLTTVLTTPPPTTYKLTYTSQLHSSQQREITEDGEWVTIVTVVTVREGGSVTEVTETQPPMTLMTVVDGHLTDFVATPEPSLVELTLGGTSFSFTSTYMSFKVAATDGVTPYGVDPAAFSPGKTFIGNYIPIILAVIVSLGIRVLDLNVKLFQPFCSLVGEKGESARLSIAVPYFEGLRSWVTPLSMAFSGYLTPLFTSLLVGGSFLLASLASEAVGVRLYGTCTWGDNEFKQGDCRCGFGHTSMFAYPLLGMIGAMVGLVAIVVVMVIRWTTGLDYNPWSITNMGILAMNPEFRAPLIALPRESESGAIKSTQLESFYGDRRYKLGFWRPQENGEDQWAIVPADDDAMGLYGDMTPHPANNGITTGINGAAGTNAHLPFVPLKFWSRITALILHSLALIALVWYMSQDREAQEKHWLSDFLSSSAEGKRFILSLIGTTCAFWWFYFFASKFRPKFYFQTLKQKR